MGILRVFAFSAFVFALLPQVLFAARVCMTEDEWKGVVGFIPSGKGTTREERKRTFGEDNRDFTIRKVICSDVKTQGRESGQASATSQGNSNPLRAILDSVSSDRCRPVLNFLIEYTRANHGDRAVDDYNSRNSAALAKEQVGGDMCGTSLGVIVDYLGQIEADENLADLAHYIKTNSYLSVVAFNSRDRSEYQRESTAGSPQRRHR